MRRTELEGKKSEKREGEKSWLGTHPLACMELLFCFLKHQTGEEKQFRWFKQISGKCTTVVLQQEQKYRNGCISRL